MSRSYKDTLNLPKTDFAMKANLPQREPKMLEHWHSIDLYAQIREKFSSKPTYILHDGPPYANGEIHLGHALNKILKDIIIKSKTLSGFNAPYVPGWDCHGLPIEINVEKKVGKAGHKVSAKAFRQACRDYAPKQIAGQKEDFKRLGVLGEWDKPYLTMDFNFEANIIRTLGKMIDQRHVYRGLKPVNWCCDCGSALAEAEVEYSPKRSTAIDVRFECVDSAGVLSTFSLEQAADEALKQAAINVVIWTTTPWTLPANLAVSLHPTTEYALVKAELDMHSDELGARGMREWYLILASDLVEPTMQRYGVNRHTVLGHCAGRDLEKQMLQHPWLARQVPVILGEHVTTESGTGAVHTAPGHGVDDYIVGQSYALEVLNPVDSRGVFNADTEHLAGTHVFKADRPVLELLTQNGHLLCVEQIEHSYPHCWRHKSPIIFRATPQWFVSMQQHQLLDKALEQVEQVQWLPERGRARIRSMLEERPDWCISRQRSWGVPITVFYHKTTGALHPKTPELLEQVARKVSAGGVEAWFDLEPSDLLGADAENYTKAEDILDVWFDSGASHACVLDERDYLSSPADLYLEGSDQHRGWFQSSLLIGTGINAQAPYKTVLTPPPPGFTVDAQGKKMSKSARNGVAPQALMKQWGADILRLWVASTDYRDDVTVSDEVFKRTADSYRRIRNTARFLLSNLDGFELEKDGLGFNHLISLDQWIISRALELQEQIIEAYASFQFHKVYQQVHNFCANELGSFYLSIVKDRVYTMPAHSLGRRSAQTALYHIGHALVRWIAPITSFTAEEIWQSLPKEPNAEPSVHLLEWYAQLNALADDQPMNHEFWSSIQILKNAVNKQMESARSDGLIKSELSAELKLFCSPEVLEQLSMFGEELRFVLLCAKVELLALDQRDDSAQATELESLFVHIERSTHEKCERCWHYHPTVGQSQDHPQLCVRCETNIEGEGEHRYYA